MKIQAMVELLDNLRNTTKELRSIANDLEELSSMVHFKELSYKIGVTQVSKLNALAAKIENATEEE